MNSLAALARRLVLPDAPAEPAHAADSTRGLDDAIARLGQRASAGSLGREPIDRQQAAVQHYWQSGRLDALRDARLVAFGLDLSAGPDGQRVLDDRTRFETLLTVADGWRTQPRAFRRCYQGLLRSYFAVDPATATPAAQTHWKLLRAYLKARAPATRDAVAGPAANPDWVVSLFRHPDVFGDTPAAGFTERLLAGDRSVLDAVCTQWGIAPASWFPRALVRAQVLAATQRPHAEFGAVLPAVLALLGEAEPWRDAGLALLLERHAESPQAPLHAGLRDAVGAAWGGPWHASGSPHWDRVGDAARTVAAQALKADLIDRFFARLADGSGPRRAAFWKRYTASIQHLEFARAGAPADLKLHTPVTDLAMVLTIGCVRLVTFTDATDALYGHDLRCPLRFDTTAPLAMGHGAVNSLRHADADLRLWHRDETNGWREWESAFAAELKDRFALRSASAPATPQAGFVDLADSRPRAVPALADAALPTASPRRQNSAGEDVHWHTAEAASVPYSRPNLEVLARVHGLTLGSDAEHAGSVTVSGTVVGTVSGAVDGVAIDRRIATVLARWGFVETASGGWRRVAVRERLALAA